MSRPPILVKKVEMVRSPLERADCCGAWRGSSLCIDRCGTSLLVALDYQPRSASSSGEPRVCVPSEDISKVVHCRTNYPNTAQWFRFVIFSFGGTNCDANCSGGTLSEAYTHTRAIDLFKEPRLGAKWYWARRSSGCS